MTQTNGTAGYSAFDGKVIFHMTGHLNVESQMVISAMMEAYPNYDALTDNELKGALNLYMLAVPKTADIEFHLEEDDHPALIHLSLFWREYQSGSDYVHLFRRFVRLVDIDVADAWWQAHEAHTPTRLMAAPELQVEEANLDDPLAGNEDAQPSETTTS